MNTQKHTPGTLLTYPGYAVILRILTGQYAEEECGNMDNREKILSAAEQLFAQQGFDSTTVDQAYKYERIVRILLGSQPADPIVRRMFDERGKRLMRCVETLLYEGVTGNFLKPVSISLYARLIVGMIYGMIALPNPPAKEDAVRSLQGVLRSLYR